MNTDPRDTVTRFWEVGFNERDTDAIRELFAPGYVNEAALPGTPPGPEGQVQLMQRLWAAFPDGRFHIEHIAVDGSTVVCVGTMSGTHEGELLGVPATGRAVRWRQCHLVDMDDAGQATRHRAIRDDLGLMRQMGALPG